MNDMKISKWSLEWHEVYMQLQKAINENKKDLGKCSEEWRKKSYLIIIDELTKIRDNWVESYK